MIYIMGAAGEVGSGQTARWMDGPLHKRDRVPPTVDDPPRSTGRAKGGRMVLTTAMTGFLGVHKTPGTFMLRLWMYTVFRAIQPC